MDRRWDARRWIPEGLCALGSIVALFWSALFAGGTFAQRDLGSYYRPAKTILAPLARASGGLPLWNPLFASGQPFAANPEHEVFHPLTSLLFLLPFEVAFRCQVILPVIGAAGAMFALLRVLRRSRRAAAFGAMAWGFGGYLLSTVNLLPILFAVCVLPLVVLFAVLVARRGRPRDVAGMAVCFALAGLAGEPSTLLMIPVVVAAAVAGERRSLDWRRCLLVCAGLLLGAALAGAMLVPGAHHASKTDRAHGLDARMASEWSLPPARLVELLAPHSLGAVVTADTRGYWPASQYRGRSFPYFYSLYPGLLATLLAGAALIARHRALAGWGALAAVGVVTALGDNFFVWPLLQKLPLLASIRYPEKFALMLLFALAVTAAHGFDQAVVGPARPRRALLAAAAAVLGAAALAAAGLASVGNPYGLVVWALRLALVAAAIAALLLARRRLGRSRVAVAACALLAVDLVTAGRPLVKTVPLASVADPPRALRPLATRPDGHTLLHLIVREPMMFLGFARPPIPAQWGIAMTLERDFDQTFLRWTNRAHNLFWQAVQRDPAMFRSLSDRRGVSALYQFRPGTNMKPGHLVAPPGAPSPDELVLSRPRPLAWAVSRVEIFRGDAGWLETVRRLGSEAARTACVEAEDLGGLPPLPQRPGPAEVGGVERTPVRILLEVNAQGPEPSFIAVDQTWDDSWRLTIDGQTARLLRTDLSLSGFVVSPGRHRVELEYVDRWVEAGLVTSLAAALVALGLVLLDRRRRNCGR